ncbi:SDR family oxidoreductase [Streptomyces mayteni]
MAGVDLNGCHAVVTGGSSGIGLATARLLAGRGARVSLLARDGERLVAAGELLRAAGASVAVERADVADRAALTAALGRLQDTWGPCDVLVNSAGTAGPGHFLDLPDGAFRRQMEVNYFGTLHAMRAVVPGMVKRGRGSVVAVSSAAALVGVFGYTAYAPSKHAVHGLMAAVRGELARHGVHSAVVFPPDVDTPQLAAENLLKPEETRAIGGMFRPLTAERVAASIVAGIERRRFVICPDLGTRALAALGGLLGPLLRREFDRRTTRARRRGHGP